MIWLLYPLLMQLILRILVVGEGVPSGAFGGHDRRRPPAQVHFNVWRLTRDLLALRRRRPVARLADRRRAALGGERRAALLLLDHEGLLRKAPSTHAAVACLTFHPFSVSFIQLVSTLYCIIQAHYKRLLILKIGNLILFLSHSQSIRSG